MVRCCFIGIVFGILFSGCRTVYIQKEFFEKYSEILKDENQKQIPFKINGTYVTAFKDRSFLNQDTIEYSAYSFYYVNHLFCVIIIPLKDSNQKIILSETDLIDAIKNGIINGRLGWGYYEIKKDKIYRYGLYEFIPGPVIFGYTLPISFGATNVVNDTLLATTEKGKLIKKFMGMRWKESDFSTKYKAEYFFKRFPVKPDSVNNDFMRQYNKFLETGNLIYKK